MTVPDYFFMLALAVGLAGILDHLWLTYVRPILAKRHGWREVDPNERIPLAAWAGSCAVLATLFVVLPFVGFAAGY